MKRQFLLIPKRNDLPMVGGVAVGRTGGIQRRTGVSWRAEGERELQTRAFIVVSVGRNKQSRASRLKIGDRIISVDLRALELSLVVWSLALR